MQKEIKNLIKDALKNLNMEVSDIVLEHPADLRMGDYSTSMAMAVAKNIKTNPQELAQKIITEILRLNLDKNIEKVEEKNGFINFYLSRKFFSQSLEELLNRGLNVGKNNSLFNQKIMVEYTDPNPFKPFHIGHLMTNAIGESIARILEHSGAVVSRANYQGDIGLHVAKAIYGLSKNKKLQDKTGTHTTQSANIGKAYANGAEAYEKGEAAKLASAQDFGEARKEIDEINKKLYDKSDEKINEIYDWGFKVTMEAFEDLYKLLGTKFDFYFLESKVAILGQQVVRDNIDKLIDSPNSKMIFEKSEGAVVFKAEKYDPKLHTRVFITSKGLPTYETKELGLTEAKFTVNPNTSLCIVITANEQTEYMKAVTKALSLIHPDYASTMKHITHGMMRLTTGKMSSRKGNIVTGESLIRDTIALVFEKIKDRDWHKEEKKKKNKKSGGGERT